MIDIVDNVGYIEENEDGEIIVDNTKMDDEGDEDDVEIIIA